MASCDYALCGSCGRKLVYEGDSDPIQGDELIYCGSCFDKWKALAGELVKVLALCRIKLRNDYALGDEKDLLNSIATIITKASEAGL